MLISGGPAPAAQRLSAAMGVGSEVGGVVHFTGLRLKGSCTAVGMRWLTQKLILC